MEILRDDNTARSYRTVLLKFLNENGLDGDSILAISRQSEVVRCPPKEIIFSQGEQVPHVFFLVEGEVGIHVTVDGKYRELGERAAVCVLGEISFFNKTAASADVMVKGDQPAVMFRISYDGLAEIIDRDPRVKDCLNRIGDLRLITQNNGFAGFRFFMDMIGWKRKRFLLDHRVLPLLEETIQKELLPRIPEGASILEVGDGPGIISEILLDLDPGLKERLNIQATHLESAVLDPFTPLPSNLDRGRFLDRTFEVLIALQVLNAVPPDRVLEQFRIAHKLVAPGGYVFMLKVRVVNVKYPGGSSETEFFFNLLESLVDRVWPGTRGGEPLIETTFQDADLEANMGWNTAVCEAAAAGKLAVPDDIQSMERELLERFLAQARGHLFIPDVLHFHWLAAKALEAGFSLDAFDHNADMGFYYQILYRY